MCACLYYPLLTETFFLCVSGGETSGVGQAGFPQHTQEADRLSAGPAGRGCGKKVCQVTLGKKQPSTAKHINTAKTAVVWRCFS